MSLFQRDSARHIRGSGKQKKMEDPKAWIGRRNATSDSLKRPLITYFYITHVTLSSMHASRETIQSWVLRSCFILKIDSCGEDYIYRAPYKSVDERPIHTTLLLSLQDHIEQRVCQEDTIEHFTQSTSSPFSPTPAPPLLHHNRWYNSNIAISST